MGVFVSKLPIVPHSLTRFVRCVFLFAPLALSACSNTRDVYASGPWGPPRPRDTTAALYANPWGPAQYGAIGTFNGVPPSDAASTARVSIEPMEPVGPWTKRRLPPAALSGEAREEQAYLPPAQEAAPTQQDRSPATPRVPDTRSTEANPPQRPQERRLTSMTGNWNASTAGGVSCRLHLSSVATLDLYKASTANCGNKTLQSINAWSLRNGQLALYSRGNVVLRASGESGIMHGVLEGTGVMVRLSR